MAKLNQIITIEKGIKSRVHGAFSELYKLVQKPELFNGFSKTYKKNNEEGEDFPPEYKRVQCETKNVLRAMESACRELFEVTARKDYTNCVAMADVKVDEVVIMTAVPVTYLLFLEKQLTDIRTFINALPVLDDTEQWVMDSGTGLYATYPTQTHRTKKVQRPLVMYPATDKHPAQTQLITEDVLVGYWQQVKQSGAIEKTKKQLLLERVVKLLQAVMQAREQANDIDEHTPPANKVLDFILEGV